MKTSPVTELERELGVQSMRLVNCKHGEWFVLADVLEAMCIQEIPYATAYNVLEDRDKDFALIACDGGLKEVAVVSENGLIQLILLFDIPEAEPFKDWFFETCYHPAETDFACQSKDVVAEIDEDRLIARGISILQARVEAQTKLSSRPTKPS